MNCPNDHPTLGAFNAEQSSHRHRRCCRGRHAGARGGRRRRGVHIGPSTTKKPYVLPVATGVETTSLLTVGDKPATNGYKMVGIPDGLGAFRAGRNFEVFMNHELQPTAGATRRHGQKGAFVSNMTIDRRTLEVKAGRDLVNPGVRYWITRHRRTRPPLRRAS